jgi:cytochrome c556
VHNVKIRILIAICFVVGSTLAQASRPHDILMKDIQATFTSLKKNLDGNLPEAVVMDAVKLEALLKEAGDFWVPFKTKDAIDFARGAQTGAASVGSAARNGDIGKATGAYGSIGKFCKGCHDSHRELTPDKTYRIKP